MLRKPPYSSRFRRILDKVPGKQTFGIYRFLPLFFALGAALEFSMINWTVGQTNFYRTYKRRLAEKLIDEKIQELKLKKTSKETQ